MHGPPTLVFEKAGAEWQHLLLPVMELSIALMSVIVLAQVFTIFPVLDSQLFVQLFLQPSVNCICRFLVACQLLEKL